MQTISELLRSTRLDQGIDLATIAAVTRINARYLRAIESDDRKSLPGDFFYKSFVHQYAAFLGLDIKAHDAEVDRVLSEGAPLPLPGAARESAERQWVQRNPARKYFSFAAVGLVLIVSIGLDTWWHKRRETPAPTLRAATGPVTAEPVAPAAVQQEPPAAISSKVELALKATEDTWLSVSSDGTPVFSGVLAANQTKTIEGGETANLRVGNAAGLEVRLNGSPLGSLGAHGQVRDLAFTSDKFHFVSQPD
jgi:cytoskeletal protein RodZ